MVDLTRQSFYLARVVKTPWWKPWQGSKRQGHQTPLKAPTCLTPSKTPQICLGLPNETSVGKVPKKSPQPILFGEEFPDPKGFINLVWPTTTGWLQPTNLNFIARWSSLRSPNNLTTIRLASLDKWYLLWSRPQKKQHRHSPSQCYPDFMEKWMGYNGIGWTQTLDLDISWTNMISSTPHKKNT